MKGLKRKKLKSAHKEDDETESVRVKEWNQRVVVNDMPVYKNWYEEGYVSRPYDQGSCGSCWAFSAASTLESLAKLNGHDTEVMEYSV